MVVTHRIKVECLYPPSQPGEILQAAVRSSKRNKLSNDENTTNIIQLPSRIEALYLRDFDVPQSVDGARGRGDNEGQRGGVARVWADVDVHWKRVAGVWTR